MTSLFVKEKEEEIIKVFMLNEEKVIIQTTNRVVMIKS